MQIIYWAHSYRKEDAVINRHFGILIKQAGRMIVNFDPPSEKVNESKLLQNLRSCDGMVAVLTWRANGPSPYILFEIGLALRARKPVIVFVDDRIPGNVLPPRVMQQRFSHRTYFRQTREHIHGLNVLKAYMGDPPTTRYQPSTDQQGCGVIGISYLDRQARAIVTQFMETRGYRIVNLEKVAYGNPLVFEQFEHVAILNVVLHCVDSRTSSARYWAGAVSASALPSISFTTNPEYRFNSMFPVEFQPRIAGAQHAPSIEEVLNVEFDLFEQNFLSAQSPDTIERYVKMQIQAGALVGNYESSTRQIFIGAIMGDQYNISGQAGAVGPNAHAHDNVFVQEAKTALADIELKVEDVAVLVSLSEALAALKVENLSLQERLAGAQHLAAIARSAETGESAVKSVAEWRQWISGLGARASSILGTIASITTIATPVAKLLGLPI